MAQHKNKRKNSHSRSIKAQHFLPKVLLYNLEDNTESGKSVRDMLAKMKIEAVTVEQSQLNETVGFLAGIPGFTASKIDVAEAKDTTAGNEENEEFMVMCHLSDLQLDNFLRSLRQGGVLIQYKAALTKVNQSWTFAYLQSEIKAEHELVAAMIELHQTVQKLSGLNPENYDRQEWLLFNAVLGEKAAMLEQEEAGFSAEDYAVAKTQLLAAYANLNAKQ